MELEDSWKTKPLEQLLEDAQVFIHLNRCMRHCCVIICDRLCTRLGKDDKDKARLTYLKENR